MALSLTQYFHASPLGLSVCLSVSISNPKKIPTEIPLRGFIILLWMFADLAVAGTTTPVTIRHALLSTEYVSQIHSMDPESKQNIAWMFVSSPV